MYCILHVNIGKRVYHII